MSSERCPCGQTYGTCRKHSGSAPAIASFEFIRDDHSEWRTHIFRPRADSDQEWDERQLHVAERISETLLKVHVKGAPPA